MSIRCRPSSPSPGDCHLQSNDASLLRGLALRLGNRLVAQDSRAGALPTLYAAVQDLPGAGFVGPDGMFEMRGAPTLVGRSPAAGDPAVARHLWTVSEELTGVTFPEPATSVRG